MMSAFAEKVMYELMLLPWYIVDIIIFISFYVIPHSVLRFPMLYDTDTFTVLFCTNFLNYAFLPHPFYIQRMSQEKWAYVIPILKLMSLLVEGVVGVDRSGSAPL